MRSPIVAILWETWRVTRGEAAWKLALGIVGGLAGLILLAAIGPMTGAGDLAFDGEVSARAARDAGAVIALFLIFLVNVVGWWSIGNLNRVRPGFPFYLLFTRPVRTSVLVGVPIAYLTAVPVVSYLVSARLLTVISGYSFPLLAVAAWIAVVNLAHAAANWPIRSKAPRLLANMGVGVAWLLLARHRLAPAEVRGPEWTRPAEWSAVFDFPFTDYALFAAVGVASLAVTVAGVARQRHGEESASRRWPPGIGFPEPLVSLFRFPCPTSSAARAQVWFDLRSRGLPVLAIGAALATLNPLLFAASVPAGEWLRVIAVMVGLSSVLAVLILGGNAFGLRWRQGRLYASAFELTQPYGTAGLAGISVVVRSACMLAALAAVGVSVWASLAFITVEGGEPLPGYQPLRSWQVALESTLGTLTASQHVALAVVASIGIAVLVASLASFAALAARYPRRLNIGGGLLLLHGVVLVPLALTGYRGVGSQTLWEFLLDALVWVTRWVDAPAILLATVYVTWRVFTERLLTPRSAGLAVLVSAAFGAAWMAILRAAGVQLADMAPTHALWMLSPVLLPLLSSVLAPWSLGRVRHT